MKLFDILRHGGSYKTKPFMQHPVTDSGKYDGHSGRRMVKNKYED